MTRRRVQRLWKKDEDPVAGRLKNSVQMWKSYCPTLVALGIDALKERHWQKIFDAIDVDVEPEFTLKDLIDWDVFAVKDKIEEISGTAQGEQNLEDQLAKIEEGWAELNLQVSGHLLF